MKRPLCIDLCCGSGGWAAGFLAAGFNVVGIDVEDHAYPGLLILGDIRRVAGHWFKDAAVIVASPPCPEFSRWDMPWLRAKNPPSPDLSLVEACRRIAREAGVPLVLENVRGAQRWIGRAQAHAGAFYLWGDVPPLPPLAVHRKERMTSSAAMRRARIPFELAAAVAAAFQTPKTTG